MVGCRRNPPPSTTRSSASSAPGCTTCADVDVAAPRDALVAFTGVSGSGKSSLAFGTIYAEAQRRYFESVAPVRPPAAAARRRAEGRRHHRAAARRRAAAAPRVGIVAVDRRHGDDAVEPAADAVLPGGHLPAGRHRATGLRRVLAEHRRRRVPGVPRPRPDPPGHRGDAGPRPVADHPRGRRRRLARRLAGPEPARHPHHARLRHRQAVAQAAEDASATGSCSPTSSRPSRSIRTGTR